MDEKLPFSSTSVQSVQMSYVNTNAYAQDQTESWFKNFELFEQISC